MGGPSLCEQKGQQRPPEHDGTGPDYEHEVVNALQHAGTISATALTENYPLFLATPGLAGCDAQRSEDQVILDSEERELPDLSAARTRAIAVASRMRAGSVVKAQTKAAFYIVGAISSLPLVVPFAEAAISSGAEGREKCHGAMS